MQLFQLKFSIYLLPTLSHLSTHLAWNSWEHGSTRTTWRVSKSLMQTTHTVWVWSLGLESPSSAEYLKVNYFFIIIIILVGKFPNNIFCKSGKWKLHCQSQWATIQFEIFLAHFDIFSRFWFVVGLLILNIVNVEFANKFGEIKSDIKHYFCQ